MKEVIILGSGQSRIICDYHCETWGVNFTYIFANKLDKLFFTDEIEEVEKADYPEMTRLKHLNPICVFPIIYPRFLNSGLRTELYPINNIRKRFNTSFFGNSISYMLAYALFHKYEKIWMYGIEYNYYEGTVKKEESGNNFWLGVALGLGIEVVIPDFSDIGKTYNRRMYGEFGINRQECPTGKYKGE